MKRFLILILLPACSEFPEVGERVSAVAETAPYVDFLTIDELDALGTPAILDTEDPIAARVESLRSRADTLRGPVISGNERTRLSETPG
ncbi:MAG: hypothetical protein AAGI10_07630 [Pseudomonadota bacterium]